MNDYKTDEQAMQALLDRLWSTLEAAEGMELQQVLDVILWVAAGVVANAADSAGVDPQAFADALVKRVYAVRQVEAAGSPQPQDFQMMAWSFSAGEA